MVASAATSTARSRVLAFLGALAMLAASALLAVVLAWWGWRWLGPATTAFVPAAPQDPALTILASGLLATSPNAPVAEASVRSGITDMRLLGVLAEARGQGYALFRLPTGPRLVAAGGEIADGATLVSVQRDGVVVRDADGERRMQLRATASSIAPAATRSTGNATARNGACVPPPGFKGDILRLNAELLGGIVAQPDTWAALALVERGALTVRDDSGFAAMLAMKKGDRIEQANGIALRAPEDIVNAVLRPLGAGQAVRLIGSRGGVAREWLLQNAGTCP